MQSDLVHFDRARQEIALATNLDEIKEIRNKAEALRLYAKQAGESLEMQNMCAEIKLRAERRAGALLLEQKRNQGETDKAIMSQPVTLSRPKLVDLGISRMQSSRWQQEAAVPETIFEEHVSNVKAQGKELTSTSLIRLSRNIREQESESVVDIQSIGDHKYQTLVIDPPWPMQKILRDVAPNQDVFDYPTMTIDAISELPVAEKTTDDAHVFLWTTQKFLPHAFGIFHDWQLRYIFTMVWHKAGGFQPFGLPQYNCEFVLYGRRGSLAFLDTKAFPCCFEGKRREHSRKPDEFYDIIRRVTPELRLDMFSREKREGFEQHGNETDKFSAEQGT